MKYIPIFRARQQEIIVLKETDFGHNIYPLLEIVKDKDRKNNQLTPIQIYSELLNVIKADKVLVDLPAYLRIGSSTNEEVVKFSRSVLDNISARTDFINALAHIKKVIPVVSSLVQKTGETDTIEQQFLDIKNNFDTIAFRTFHNTFDEDIKEILKLIRKDSDIFIYDLDSVPITSAIFRKHRTQITAAGLANKVLFRSAINTDIQNVKLDHGDIVADADNSLVELYDTYSFEGFGDYVGIKKDDLTSGGTISPGFIFFDPYDNMYYGYKGNLKKLDEFETTIVPAVINSDVVKNLLSKFPQYLDSNPGYNCLMEIYRKNESGKNQAKFKKIAMQHYLHCMKVSIDESLRLPLSINN